MKIFQKLIITMLLAVFAATLMPADLIPGANAANTILPGFTDEELADACTPGTDTWESLKPWFSDQTWLQEQMSNPNNTKEDIYFILACGLKTGNIGFWMIPYFILHALEFIISLAGLLAIVMIIVGAYYYMYGGLTDDKEKGKTIIKYAIGGLILTTLSWVVTNIVLAALTS